MSLTVEDGSIVPDANTFAGVQEAAAFHALRGGLIPVSEINSDQVTFSEGGVLTAPDGTFATIPNQSIVRISGAAETGNGGFGHVRSVSATQLSVAWLETVDETVGAAVTIVIYEQSGWWHAAPSRLEASLINATSFMGSRYAWAGVIAEAGQPLQWPRRSVYINPSGFVGSGALPNIGWQEVPSDSIPEGVVRCQLWLALADIEAPLLASVDPQEFLISQAISGTGIAKTFGGKVRLRRHPHADAEVAQYLVNDIDGVGTMPGGPFRRIVNV